MLCGTRAPSYGLNKLMEMEERCASSLEEQGQDQGVFRVGFKGEVLENKHFD